MLLKFKNLTIRNATLDDAEQLAIWWNDGKIMAHAGLPNGSGQTPISITQDLLNEPDRRLIIELDNIAIGEMSCRNETVDVAEIGIKICDFSKHDKGIGKILLSMLIDSLFSDFGYKKIILSTNLNNQRAQHVYEMLGFTKIKVNVDTWKNQLGELQSFIDYELYVHQFINFAK